MNTRGVLFPFSLFIALAIVIFPAIAPAQNEVPAFAEIFSKDDARAWFAMTRDEWQENVRRNVAAGAASALEAQETGVALVARSAAGDLFVIRPLYLSGPEKPDVVHVTVHYRGARAAQFADPMVERALSDARRVLAPEFELNDGVERTAQRLPEACPSPGWPVSVCVCVVGAVEGLNPGPKCVEICENATQALPKTPVAENSFELTD